MVWPYGLRCFECHTPQPNRESGFKCGKCGGLLEVSFDLTKRRKIPWDKRPLSVWKYREILPVDSDGAITSLGEGGTGLHRCRRLGRRLGLKNFYVKNEGENPTGSFKDRGMTLAISKARELGKKKMVCASTGNTAASLAAYSARAGLECIVFVPAGKVAGGKMVQVVMHGAKIVQVMGDFDQALEAVVQLCERRRDLYLMNSVNPFRLEGQKTLAYEVHDQLSGVVPGAVILPVGNGGNISAIWKGFTELQQLRLTKGWPRMIGVQASKAAPIAGAVRQKRSRIRPVPKPETVATAIRIGSPVNWTKALRAIKESDGTADTVTDLQILQAQKQLAEDEGIFVEPASAASIAGLKKLAEAGEFGAAERVVCVTTGHGLKDPSVVEYISQPRPYTLDPGDLSRLDLFIGLTR